MSFIDVTLQLADGFMTTLLIFAITLVCSLPLGLIITFGSMSKLAPFGFLRDRAKSPVMKAVAEFRPISCITKLFVWIIRGTPLMIQIILVFYGPGLIFGVRGMDRLPAVLIAFIINYACYFSEIYRGGIQSISKGQYEAGQVLGMTKRETFFKVILLQVVKRIIPPMSNEIITLVKDTALARALSVIEIIAIAYEKVNKYAVLTPLLYAGLFYLAFSGLLTILFHLLDKKLSYYTV